MNENDLRKKLICEDAHNESEPTTAMSSTPDFHKLNVTE